mmetsp:Transcript_48309/g.72027  ORF Transcript_48309/g.72027 Transcript_48309/m.72027 type:complete len:89 (+) Transcript_48309:1-267(+)
MKTGTAVTEHAKRLDLAPEATSDVEDYMINKRINEYYITSYHIMSTNNGEPFFHEKLACQGTNNVLLVCDGNQQRFICLRSSLISLAF